MTFVPNPTYPEWSRLLHGGDEAASVKILAAVPFGGFFRVKPNGLNVWRPLAIWKGTDGSWRAKLWTDRLDDIAKVWPRCAATPISHEAYTAALADGVVPVSEEEERTSPGANNPPDDILDVKAALEEEIEKAKRMCKAGAAKSKEQFDEADALIKRITAMGERINKHRTALVKPLNDEVAAINAVWKRPEDDADLWRKKLGNDVTKPFTVAERDRERREREEAAAKKRADAEAAAAAARESASEDATIEAEKARRDAEAAERQVNAKSTVKAGAARVQKRWVPTIVDPKAFAGHLIDMQNAEIMSVLKMVANRMAIAMKTTTPAPGVTATEENI